MHALQILCDFHQSWAAWPIDKDGRSCNPAHLAGIKLAAPELDQVTPKSSITLCDGVCAHACMDAYIRMNFVCSICSKGLMYMSSMVSNWMGNHVLRFLNCRVLTR